MLGLLYLIGIGRAENAVAEKGVIETPVANLNFIPGVFNDSIGLQNAIVKKDKVILRSTIDDSSMMRWEIPVPVDNWSFTFDFNELNLDSRESAGLYFFYTKEKQRLGNFKGATSKYHGLMSGIEFTGKGVDLVYAKNNGDDYGGIGEYVTKMDSLNPNRFANIEKLKLKVICTKKNFKVEVFDGERVIYDNFRYFEAEELEHHKKGKYLSIVAEYRHVSSGKAFEITGAQFNHREETDEYSTSNLKMEQIIPQMKTRNEIIHSNKEVNDLIFNINAVSNYTRSMLGELPETSLSKAEKEILKEIDSLTTKLKTISELNLNKKKTVGFATGLNTINLKVQGLEKKIHELEISLEQNTEKYEKKLSIFENLAIFVCVIVTGMLGFKTYFTSSPINRKLTRTLMA